MTARVDCCLALNKRLTKPLGIFSFAVHPGAVWGTELNRHMTEDEIVLIAPIQMTVFNKDLDQGASTHIVAALHLKLVPDSGVNLSDCQIAQASPWATDELLAEQLWKLSNDLAGEAFN